MIFRKKVIKEVSVHDKEICDICKKEIREGTFDSSDIDIEAKIGDHYPEGDFRRGYRLDVCKDCFVDKVMPLIESTFGVKFTEYDCDDFEGYYTDNEDDDYPDLIKP